MRRRGPDPYREELILWELKEAREPLYIRELARRLSAAMSYRTVWRYVTEFMPEIRRERRYGPAGEWMVFLELPGG